MMRSLWLGLLTVCMVLAVQMPLMAQECETDDDCLEDEMCMDGVCIPSGIPMECETDVDCDEGEMCVEGLCVEEGNTCETDDDCPVDWVCIDGFCNEAGEIPDECVTDDDCEEDATCVDGVCIPSGIPEGCEADDECAEGEVCAWGACMAAELFCSSDADCSEWEACETECAIGYASDEGEEECEQEIGWCVPVPEKIETDPDCVEFCAAIMPCMEGEAEEGSEGEGTEPAEGEKADDLDDPTGEVEECEFFCSLGLLEEEVKAEMDALVACVLENDTCEEMEANCADEAEVASEGVATSTKTGEEAAVGEPQGGDNEPAAFGFNKESTGGDGDGTPKDGNEETGDKDDGGSSGCSAGTGSSGMGMLLLLLVPCLLIGRRRVTA